VKYTDRQETATRAQEMDDYQEELLEFRANELDPLEPADDATEL
jgi:hypothetical protein